MQRPTNPQETAALGLARRRAALFIGIGALVAIAMWFLTGEFVMLHCVVLAALTLAAAISSAWAAAAVLPETSRRAGMLGGMAAAMAYVLPFVALFAYRILTMDSATAAALAGDMSAAQATSLVQQGIMPGVEYYRGQYLAYAVGYLLFGLLFGMLLGALGGVLAQRYSHK
jgi:hypothetical protein